MVARKTKRVAAVTALSASLMMVGAAAFAKPGETSPPCPRGQWDEYGRGLHSHHDEHPGNGYEEGWPHKKCDKQDNNNGGGSNPGDGSTGGGTNPGGGSNNGGGTANDGNGIAVDVSVEVDLPDITVPNAATAVDGVVDHAVTAAGQTVALAESDVAALMTIVEAAGEGATSLVYGTAQAGVSLSGTSASGTLNVSGGAAGATTLASNLTGSTLNFVNGNVTGAGYILGTMISML